MVELVTKHYTIFGKQIPIQLKFYVNNSEKLVVARYTNLDYTISTKTGEMMDNSIKSGFESIFKCNMKRYNISNINDYLKFRENGSFYNMKEILSATVVLIENPDDQDSESFMIGNRV